MKLRTLLIINTATSVLFGLGFVLAPAAMMAPYGIVLDPGGIAITRLFGAAYLGLAALTIAGLRAKEREARWVVVIAQSVGLSVGFLMALINQLPNPSNAMGWSTVVIYLLLALGYLYFAILRPDKI